MRPKTIPTKTTKQTATTRNISLPRSHHIMKPRALANAWLIGSMFALIGFVFSPISNPICAQVTQGKPEVAKGIGVEQKLGADLPMHVEFEDDKNRFIQFGHLFKGNHPVLLSFNYSDCPQLCNVQLNNLVTALHNIELVPGKDFEIVSISIDPNEQTRKLANTKQNYVVSYGKMDSADGWHFLRGSKKNIKVMADACGFQYKYLPQTKQYSHPAAFIFCTSDGRIARYLDGLDGTLETSLQPALIEAGRGKIGSLADKVKYFAGCYYFDPTTGKYSTSAIGLLRIAGLATIVGLVVGIAPYWLRRRLSSDGKEVRHIDEIETTEIEPANEKLAD